MSIFLYPFSHTTLFILGLISVPLLIMLFEKNKIIKENKNYVALEEQLIRQADEKIREAVKQSGIIPLSASYVNEFNEGLYLDKNHNTVVLFEAESMVFDDKRNKVPRPLIRILEKLSQSELIEVGWSMCYRDYAEDFISRLAVLDDELDFKLVKDKTSIENKIIFSHTMPFLEKDDKPSENVLTIHDGDVNLNLLDPSIDGSLTLIIKAEAFFKTYGKNEEIFVGSVKFTI
ncbi:hypothetical protein N9522_03165 [Candidatus Thioglobus sp.]|nr:hypothetical protein [Candidatus Thioglobus sp.]